MDKNIEKDFNIEDIKNILVETLDAQKAEDIHDISLKDTSFPADYMIIASGASSKQVTGIAQKVIDKLATLGIKEIKKEGMGSGDWVILDTGDIILHLFRPEVRLFYNIEKMWDTDISSVSTA